MSILPAEYRKLTEDATGENIMKVTIVLNNCYMEAESEESDLPVKKRKSRMNRMEKLSMYGWRR